MNNPLARCVRTLVSVGLLCGLAGCGDLRVPDPDVIYIAFGDSATDGSAQRDYVEVLGELLDLPAEQFTKEGAGGETIADGVDRLDALLAADIYPNADVLLLWAGGADLIDFIAEEDPFLLWSVEDSDYPYGDELDAQLAQIAGALAEAVALGKAAGLRVYVATYYPIQVGSSSCPAVPFDYIIPGQAERANEYVGLLNARIRQVASASGATVVDIGRDAASLADDEDNYVNCNHLSAAGNAQVAAVFRDALR